MPGKIAVSAIADDVVQLPVIQFEEASRSSAQRAMRWFRVIAEYAAEDSMTATACSWSSVWCFMVGSCFKGRSAHAFRGIIARRYSDKSGSLTELVTAKLGWLDRKRDPFLKICDNLEGLLTDNRIFKQRNVDIGGIIFRTTRAT